MKRAALVTGGSEGIGFAIARMLGQQGYAVTIVARSAENWPRQRGRSSNPELRRPGKAGRLR